MMMMVLVLMGLMMLRPPPTPRRRGDDGDDDFPLSGALEQQDLIPLGGDQEFRRRRDLGWTWKN